MHLPQLTRRILLLVIASLLPLVLGYALILAASVRYGNQGALRFTQTRARILSESVKLHLEKNLVWLSDIALGLSFGEPAKETLRQSNPYSLLRHGLIVTDLEGNVRASWPETSIRKLAPEVLARLKEEGSPSRPFVSGLVAKEPSGRTTGFMLAPVRESAGKIKGWVGGELDFQDPVFVRLLEAGREPSDNFVAILDDAGRAFAFVGDSRAFLVKGHAGLINQARYDESPRTVRCKGCHKKGARGGVLAVASVTLAPWCVAILTVPNGPSGSPLGLWKAFGLLGLGLSLGGLILGVGMSRSILQPIRSLIEGAKRIGDGDLSIPVPIQGSDEITVLAEGLEQARLRLLESFLTIQQVNEELETKVQERTMQVQSLLRKVIGSQEEERKRIARELHDVVLQDIAAFLMKLDVLALSERKDQGRIEKMRGLLTKAMEDIRAIIQGLRPSILDDLGLDEALRWVVDRRFQNQECEVSIEVKGYSKGQLDSNIETVTFRIAQEALTNVLKHARASRAVLRLTCSSRGLTIFVHDNGVGFAAAEYKKEVRTAAGSGIGLQGMAERASLVGGRLKIRSSPGRGSHVRLFIPLGRSVDETAD